MLEELANKVRAEIMRPVDEEIIQQLLLNSAKEPYVIFDCLGIPVTLDLTCALCFHPLDLSELHHCKKNKATLYVEEKKKGLIPFVFKPEKRQYMDKNVLELVDEILAPEETIFGIVSGGMNGVEAAALETAIERNIEAGGFAPAKFRTLDRNGKIVSDLSLEKRYHLKENQSVRIEDRMASNILISDGTLIIDHTMPPIYSYETNITITAIHETSTSRVEKDAKGRSKTVEIPHKPYFLLRVVRDKTGRVVPLDSKILPKTVADWILENNISTLHVTGSSEFLFSGIGQFTSAFLGGVLYELGL